MNDRNLNCFSTSLFLPFLFLSPLPPHFLAKVSFLLINPNTLWYRPREERREGGREAESSSREWNMKIFGGATIACLLRRLSLYLYASRVKLCSSCVSPLFYPRFFSRRGSIDDRFDESLETLELKNGIGTPRWKRGKSSSKGRAPTHDNSSLWREKRSAIINSFASIYIYI